MKKTKNKILLICSLIISLGLASQTTVPGGLVYGNWSLSGSPYNVMGSIQIPTDSTLTIQPGVQVIFQGTYKLAVQGRLIAIGTTVDTIKFTAANTTNGWRGIRFINTPNTNDTSRIMYCKLTYGKATGASPDNNGGAIYIDSYSKIIISHNRISNCSANNNGGGIYLWNSYPPITYNTICNNSATTFFATGYGGGGIFSYLSSTYNYNFNIKYNVISNNSTLSFGGGIFYERSSPTVSNNIIINNTAAGGGGIYGAQKNSFNQDAAFTNNTIANNASTSNGGGIYCDLDADPISRNCIIYGNTAAAAGPQIFLNDDPSDPSFYYNNVQGGSGGIDPNGNIYVGTYANNINSNPLFVSSSAGSGTGFNGLSGDWSLQNTSPSINTGDPAMVVQSTDIIGNPRITVCRIDQGAYEYQNGIPFGVTISQTSPIPCAGYATGALMANATGSGGPYSYTWTPGGSNASSLTNLTAGFYTVTASNSTGCIRTATFNLSEPTGMSLGINQTDINCNGNCDGYADVTVYGGTGPFTYTWTTVPPQNTYSTTATLCSGAYTISVTDGGGCMTSETVSITAPGALSYTPNLTDVSCKSGNNGSIIVNASGGAGTLQYSINGGLNYQTSNTFFGLTALSYTIVVKDSSGCQASPSIVIINEPSALTTSIAQTDLRCYGATNGTATVTVNGGTPSYTYSWAPSGGASAIATNLSANNYTVTVTDSKSCVTTETINIVSILSPPAICMVTVDSTSTNNIIYWDKTVYPATEIDSFVIYRETSSNVYKWIGAVSKDSVSMFTDINRSVTPANGDPNIGYYHYKLAIRDSCGSYSALSPYHTSVYFVDNQNGTFTWNTYNVQGQSTPVANFNLMRDSINIGDWRLVGAVAGTTTTLNDPTYSAYQFIGNWRVEATGLTCIPTMRLGNNSVQTTIVKAKSNISNNRTTKIGSEIGNSTDIVFPNPFTSIVRITQVREPARVEVCNPVGEKVFAALLTKQDQEINLSELQNGIYFIKIINEKGSTTKKIIKE